MKRFKLRIEGPDGKIETVINDPIEDRKGVAFIAHPHPLHGGTMDNKVVQTLAETLVQLGYVAVRPNFRGVGMSEGDYDHGAGEVEDMLATVRFVQGHYPNLPILLAGFSFGAYVQAQVCRRLPCQKLLLVGPAVNMFEFGDIPLGTHIIHGEKDELVPLAWVEPWAHQYEAKLAVIKGADHFFNRKLAQLKQAVTESCQS